MKYFWAKINKIRSSNRVHVLLSHIYTHVFGKINIKLLTERDATKEVGKSWQWNTFTFDFIDFFHVFYVLWEKNSPHGRTHCSLRIWPATSLIRVHASPGASSPGTTRKSAQHLLFSVPSLWLQARGVREWGFPLTASPAEHAQAWAVREVSQAVCLSKSFHIIILGQKVA